MTLLKINIEPGPAVAKAMAGAACRPATPVRPILTSKIAKR